MKALKFPLAFAIAATTLAMSITPAFAETSTTEPTGSRVPGVAKVTEELCDRITQRMENQQERLEERLEKIEELHAKHQERLEKLRDKAAELGVDISELESMLESMKGYTEEIVDIRIQIRSEVEQGAEAVCSGDRESAREHFVTSREYVEQVKSLREDRRNYFKNTVVPELQSIKEQLREASSGTEGAEA